MKRLALTLSFLVLVCPAASAEITHITCGGHGDRPCTVADGEWWEGGLQIDGCDRGLYSDYIGYCRDRADWFPYPCISYRYPWQCKTDRRDNESWIIASRPYTDQLFAQMELGRNEPINWINLIGTHNAFNNASDGYIKPNQRHSMTEQLDAGARVLFLDVHQEATCNCLKLAHAQADGLGDAIFDRHLIYGFREIREWLRNNPEQFVILRFETYFEEGQADDPELAADSFRKMLDAELSPYLLPANRKPADRWPTLAEMRANSWRAIAISDGPVNEWVHNGKYSKKGVKPKHMVSKLENGEPLPMPTAQKFTHIEEDSLRYPTYGDTCTDYNGLFDDWTEGPGMICPLNEPCEKGGRHSLYDWCPMERIIPIDEVAKHGFSTVSFDRWRDDIFTESGEVFGDDWPLDHLIWSAQYAPSTCSTCRDNLAAAMRAGDGRWYDADPTESRHFACTYAREGDPSNWIDVIQGRGPRTDWRITEARGPWEEGWQACAEEFGETLRVFSVPANSWQNEDLKELMATHEFDVWLAYRDTDQELGREHVAWDIDRGISDSGIRSDPAVSHEGQRVRFESSWPVADLFDCTDQGDILATVAATDSWDFGDGSPPSSSDEFEVTQDGIRFIKWHAFLNDRVPFPVRHTLPAPCPDDSRIYGQVVFNTDPEIRADCEVWHECGDAIGRDELSMYAGDAVIHTAAWHDAGVGDAHVSYFDWGDGERSSASVNRDATPVHPASGNVSVSHAYNSCDTFRVDVVITDIDRGRGSDYQMVRIEETPPVLTCPDDVLAEATSPDGASVALEDPGVYGGFCGDVAVTNDAASPFALGTSSVTWTAINSTASLDAQSGDHIQLEDSCAQVVTVVDTTPPDVQAPSRKHVIAYRDGNDIGNATVTDAVGIVGTYNDAPAAFPPGDTTVTWYAVDAAGNTGSDTQIVSAANKVGTGATGPFLLVVLVIVAARRRLRSLL